MNYDNTSDAGYTDEDDDEMMTGGTNRDVGETSMDDTDEVERDESI